MTHYSVDLARQLKSLFKDKLVCGIDEAGRGPLAGPVTVACVCLPKKFNNNEIKDSKLLTDEKRRKLFSLITKKALAYSIISIGPRRIDQINILAATKLGMKIAAEKVNQKLKILFPAEESHFLIDGNARIESTLSHDAIIQGDRKILAISAASILAKVTRDNLMEMLCKRYPNYEFSRHKGYGTAIHRKAIADFGPSPVHRKTFGGVIEFVQIQEEFNWNSWRTGSS